MPLCVIGNHKSSRARHVDYVDNRRSEEVTIGDQNKWCAMDLAVG